MNAPGIKLTRKSRRRTGSKKLAQLSQDGLADLAGQIIRLLERAQVEGLADEMDLATFSRLANVLVRVAEAGLKCEKQRLSEESRNPLAAKQADMASIERQLKLL